MISIVICIPTYKRSRLLQNLLATIAANIRHVEEYASVRTLVFDNDPERSSESVVRNNIDSFGSEISYYNFSERGLANVRNNLIDTALSINSDFIVCVDDDQEVSEEWLKALIDTILLNKGDIVMGPVYPKFVSKVPNYISCYFKPHRIKNNEKISFFESNNFIISSEFLLSNNLRFDSRFNFTGGEDAYFGFQALKKGARIFWAEDAVVYEEVSELRADIRWIIERKFRTSNTYTYILFLERKIFAISYKLAKSVFYSIASLPLFILCLSTTKFKFIGFIKFFEALGGLTAVFKKRYNGYD